MTNSSNAIRTVYSLIYAVEGLRKHVILFCCCPLYTAGTPLMQCVLNICVYTSHNSRDLTT